MLYDRTFSGVTLILLESISTATMFLFGASNDAATHVLTLEQLCGYHSSSSSAIQTYPQITKVTVGGYSIHDLAQV